MHEECANALHQRCAAVENEIALIAFNGGGPYFLEEMVFSHSVFDLLAGSCMADAFDVLLLRTIAGVLDDFIAEEGDKRQCP